MIKEYNTLYKTDSVGNTREWRQEQDGNRYRTISGIVGGQLVTSEWTSVEGKNPGKANATISTEQAQKEIEAKYTKQLKLGYTLVRGQEHHRVIKPMLAKKYVDYKDKLGNLDGSKKWIIQTKYNGSRMVATKDGCFTRTGERYMSIPHIEESLRPFFRAHPEAILDGELFNYKLRQKLNELMEIIRKTVHITEKHLEISKKIVEYHVYDGYGFLPATDHYSNRSLWIRENLNVDHVVLVESYPIVNFEQQYQNIIMDGHEGIMLRDADSPYENKRSKYLLKHKPTDDMEVKIVDIQEGSGNWAGMGKVVVVQLPDGREFSCTFKGSMEDCRQFLIDKKKWLDRTVTIYYNGLTGLGIPNFAQFDYCGAIKS